jgi:hypothetical protein
MTHRRFLFAVILVASRSLTAQIMSTIPLPSPAQCAAASQTLTSGSVAAADSQVDARDIAGVCDQSADIVTALGRWKTTTDTLSARAIFSPAFADSTVVGAAISIAADGGASQLARVLAIRLVLARLYPTAMPTLHDLTDATEPGGACLVPPGLHERADVRPVSQSNRTQMLQQIGPLEWNTSQPTAVRRAVNCLMNSWRVANAYPPLQLVDMTPTSLRVAYVCSSRFQIKNTLYTPLIVQYKVGSGAMQTITIKQRDAGETEGISEFDTHDRSALVSLYVDGNVVSIAQATGTACS